MKKARIGIRGKTIFLILLMGISLGAVLIGMTASILSTIVRNDYENKVLDICKNASFAIDGDELGRLQEKYREVLFAIPDSEWVLSDAWGSPEFESFLSKFESLEETPEYKDLCERMTVLLEANDVDDIYLCGIDNTCQPVAFYLVDPAPGEDQCRIGTLDPLYYENSERLLADPTVGFLPYTTDTPEYGWLVTGGVAVFDSSGNVAGYILADISMESIMREIESFIRKLVLAVVLITAVTITLYMLAIEHMVIQPVKKLAQSASVYLSKDTEETEKHSFRELSIKSKDEIGDLYEAICRMEENLNAHIASVMEMTAEKERLGAELDVAARIQEALVPAGFKAFSEENRVDVFGAMVPAKEVGGDFYDFFRIDHDHLGLVMADVSGKGVAAALFMAVTKTFLQSRTMMGGKPEEIMADANRWLCANNQAGLFVTVWLGIYEISSGEILYVNAGHEYPVRMANGVPFVLRTENDPPLGTDEDLEFTGRRMALAKGEMLALYTDGIPEAKDAEGKRYGMDRMKAALEEKLTARDAVEGLESDLKSFVGDADPFDDVTILCLVRK